MDANLHNLGFTAEPQPNAFKNLYKSFQIGGVGNEVVYSTDTTLRLYSPDFATFLPSMPKGVKRKWSFVDDPVNQKVVSSLGLHLGHSPSSSESKGSVATACTSVSSAKETEEESSVDLELDFALHLGGDKLSGTEKSASSNLKLLEAWPNVDLQLSLSSGPTVSDITTVYPSSFAPENLTKRVTDCRELYTVEGSTGSPFVSLQAEQHMENISYPDQYMGTMKTISSSLSSSFMTTQKSPVSCTSGMMQSKQQRSSSTKQCQYQGCLKGARGASGHCIGHGGGRRCQRPGCHKGAEGRTAFCKTHGGGRRCEFLGCTKSAEGRTDFCIAHGGGRRCSQEECTRAARGKSGLCIRHGGGKRCKVKNCSKSAEGLSGLCIAHGGGRRCQYPECHKGAQGSTVFCKAHGGGKRCTYLDCKKGAEGSTPFCKGHGGGKRCSFQGGGICPKSVHGGTLFCVAHGGGKRCSIQGCTRSARGRTEFCVRHGGGKRCQSEGCGKSAQGSTDFCKAHGGGKRCSWGHTDSEFGQGGAPCNTFVSGKVGLCTSHGAELRDKRVHGGATTGIVIQDSHFSQPAKISQDISAEDMNIDNNIVNSTSRRNYFGPEHTHLPFGGNQSSGKAPEGRVHGGNLMAVLAHNPGLNFIINNNNNGHQSQGSL